MGLKISLPTTFGITCPNGYLKISEVPQGFYSDSFLVIFFVWVDQDARNDGKAMLGKIALSCECADVEGKSRTELYTWAKTKTVNFQGAEIDLSTAVDC